MYLDMHVLQSVPPCDMNRDDTGTPKTAIYGGYQRSRVSSQAWKHAMREMFPRLVDAEKLGVRTKHAVALIKEAIDRKNPDLQEVSEDLASDVLKITGVKTEKSRRSGSEEGSAVSQYLIFIARSEIEKLADIAVEAREAGEDLSKPSKDWKKKVQEAFHGKQALDIALFGRMLADAPDLNTDASAQVAHAISVNKVTQEYDYFTAVDDCSADDNAGAAMLDTIGFNSSTLYRYATVCLPSLEEQLGDVEAAAAGAQAFLKAFVESMPTGKQNTFANRTLPSLVLVALRNDQPVNGVSAFESPVIAKEGDSISRQAEDRLARKLAEFSETYGNAPAKVWWTAVDGGAESLERIGEKVSFPEMLEGVRSSVAEALSAGEA
ncbi:type I-E CRISPR-associated protein Cas7/Cse4/CasC [Olsenella sp. YH-ols2223]|uniref:Type I-E CRISPR-associated protein Cas7/Cse4/CasC n=1 Tax=Olsenella absiana TaxID=3115222 RepID=A0ABU7RC66_9ACTN